MEMQGFLEFLKKNFQPHRTYEHADSGITVRVERVMIQIPDNFLQQKHFVETLGVPFEIPLECVLQDPAIIQTARVSTGNDKKAMTDKAFQTLALLYEGRHITPFESVMFQFDITCPIQFVDYFFAQFGSFNELSGRYSEFDINRQGFYLFPEVLERPEILREVQAAHKKSLSLYDDFIENGVAREQARFVLPYSFMTKFRWTVSLRHVLEFLFLEKFSLVPEIFWDMRDKIFMSIIENWVPGTYTVFQEIPRSICTSFLEEHGNVLPNIEYSQKILRRKKEEKGVFHSFVGDVSFFESFGDEDVLLACLVGCPNPQQGFTHGGMTIYFRIPIFVFRQFRRHRNGSWVLFPPDFDSIVYRNDFYIPPVFRSQVGSSMSYTFQNVSKEKNFMFLQKYSRHIREMMLLFSILRNAGVKAPIASCVLPYSFRIESVWTTNVGSLMNFFSLRLDTHAQTEARECAETVYQFFASRFPITNQFFLRNINFGKSSLFKP